MMPTAAEVLAFLGSEEGSTAELEAKATAHLPVVVQQVRAYVRGNGFDELGNPAEDLEAVIVSACARSVGNPEVMQSKDTAIDDARFAERFGVFNGWTLAELAILHRYRKRAL